MLPYTLQQLIDILSKLPSIGPRQATRLAFHLIHEGPQALQNFAQTIENASRIKVCERCFFVHENQGSLCGICASHERNQDIIMIVEKETDLLSLENTHKFTGRYLVVGEIPRSGLLEEWQRLRLRNLQKFIEKELGGKAREIIVAFNPTTVGDFHASLIAKELAPYAETISRLGRGLPTGGEIEFADDETLGSALERRS